MTVDTQSLPNSAEIVIVGGGVIGLSIAYHLAERGAVDVVVLERDAIASGATSKATGGIRQQFSTESNIRLSLESVRFFENFEERVGLPFLFRQIGYLFLISSDDQLAVIAKGVQVQNSLGVPTDVITSDEVTKRYPMIDGTGVVGATFCPTDGSGSPGDAAYAFGSRARDLGVRIVEGAEVIAIDKDHGAVTAVRTPSDRIATSTVVNAAGPWAPLVGQIAGTELPIEPHPRQVFTVTPVKGLGESFPFMVDMATGVYVHQEPGSIVLGGGDRDRLSSYEATLDWTRFEGLVTAVTRRVPFLEDAGSISGWCGLRDMTPDDHPILGPVAYPQGMWCAAGFSGHGFMHAPAVGRIIAEWLLDGEPTGVDTPAFLLERFDSANVSVEATVF